MIIIIYLHRLYLRISLSKKLIIKDDTDKNINSHMLK